MWGQGHPELSECIAWMRTLTSGTFTRKSRSRTPILPSHILASRTRLWSRISGTTEIGQEDPGNQRNNQLTQIPPCRECSKKILVTVIVRYCLCSMIGNNHLPGTNSKNIIESTGTLPPAAVPITPQSALKVTKFVEPAAAHRKTPAMNRVQLNAGFLPMRSLDRPQNEAPKISPT